MDRRPPLVVSRADKYANVQVQMNPLMMNLCFKKKMEESAPLPPNQASMPRKRNTRHNHGIKSECLPLDQAAKLVSNPATVHV